jgi:YidC/Oxa1 family membrane protein insertase
MQQKMMNYMMVVMGVMFFKVASGLCVYFIASTLWSLGERKLLPKIMPIKAADTTGGTTPPASSSGGGPSGGSGFWPFGGGSDGEDKDKGGRGNRKKQKGRK